MIAKSRSDIGLLAYLSLPARMVVSMTEKEIASFDGQLLA
jgi:hypothetical protein